MSETGTSLPALATIVVEAHAAVRRAHQEVGRARRDVLVHAKTAGDALLKIKAHVGHGQYLSLLSHCRDLSIRTAEVYTKISTHWSQIESALNSQHAANFSLRRALRIIAESRADDPGSPRAQKVTWEEVLPVERQALRRIVEEMATFPFEGRLFIEAGPGRGGDVDVKAGVAGAPVYWDIVGGNPDVGRATFKYTRGQVLGKLHTFINNGKRSIVSDLAVDVARRRLKGDPTLQPASLPPSAGDVPTPMQMTVTMTMTEKQRSELTDLLGQFDAARLVAILEDALYPQALEEFERTVEGTAA